MLVAQLNLIRDQAAEAPSLVVLAATNGLHVTRAASAGKPLSVAGIDAQLSGNIDAKQNLALADLRLLDERGLLAVASARIETDVKALWTRPAESVTRLRAAPVVATLVVHGRPLDELPVPLRPTGCSARCTPSSACAARWRSRTFPPKRPSRSSRSATRRKSCRSTSAGRCNTIREPRGSASACRRT